MLKDQVKLVFRKFDLRCDGMIDLQNFQQVVMKEPQLLDIFDYVSRGFQDSMNPFWQLPPQMRQLRFDIEKLEKKLIFVQKIATKEEDPNVGEIEDEEEKEKKEEIQTLPRPRATISERFSVAVAETLSLDPFKKMENIKNTIFLDPIMTEMTNMRMTFCFFKNTKLLYSTGPSVQNRSISFKRVHGMIFI